MKFRAVNATAVAPDSPGGKIPDLNYNPASLGLVLRRDSTNAAVRIANNDLYWIRQPGTWDQAEVLSTNIAGRYYRNNFDPPPYPGHLRSWCRFLSSAPKCAAFARCRF